MSGYIAAIGNVRDEIAKAQAQLAGHSDQCTALLKEQEILRGQVRGDFNLLARLQAEATAGAAPDVARDLLDLSSADLERRTRRIAVLDDELKQLLDTEQQLQQSTHDATARRDAADDQLQQLRDQVEARLCTGQDFLALRDALQLAEARADTVDRMATSAQAEHDAKAGAYQADPVFRYLLSRDFGGSSYRGWPLVRTVDGWLAELCGFARARREYATLVELPPYLRQHAGQARDEVEAARQPLQDMREAALAEAGGDPLRQVLQSAQAMLAQALLAEQLQRQAVDGTQSQIDAMRSWTDSEGASLLATLARTLSSRSLEDLYQRVAATATAEDDAVLERIHGTRVRLDAIEAELGERSGDMAALKRSLDNLQSALRSYQLAADQERSFREAEVRRTTHTIATSFFSTTTRSSNRSQPTRSSAGLFDWAGGSSRSSRPDSSARSSSRGSSSSSSAGSSGGGGFRSGGGVSGGGGFKTGGGF